MSCFGCCGEDDMHKSYDNGTYMPNNAAACASNFPRHASDYALSVPSGGYAVIANHCVQCSCTPGSRLYCQPASMSVSCSSMQCKRSNLMLGNVTVQQSSAGCNVTSCDYGGFVNGTIITTLSSSLEPRCPGPQHVPQLIAPPIVVSPDMVSAPPTLASPDMVSAPAPSPFQIGGAPISGLPGQVVPSTSSSIVFPPSANGPSGTSSRACILVNPLSSFSLAMVLVLFLKVMFPFL